MIVIHTQAGQRETSVIQGIELTVNTSPLCLSLTDSLQNHYVNIFSNNLNHKITIITSFKVSLSAYLIVSPQMSQV